MKHLLKTTLLLLALILPTFGTAHDFEVDGIYYKVNGNEATVTHKGSAYYEFSNEYSGDVVIPAVVTYNGRTYSVTSIGSSTFYDCRNLTSIEIPNTITLISSQAFFRCQGLMNIEIPNSVDSIGARAFYGCTGLTSVVIPNSVTSIGDYAFYQCAGLTSVDISNSVTAIGYDAFESTAWFDMQPIGLVYAGPIAYKYKGEMSDDTQITLKEGTNGIAAAAFSKCYGLTGIYIPNSVKTIGSEAFRGCSNLTSIVIPNSVNDIGACVFVDCNRLVSIEIPQSFTSIGEFAFGWSGTPWYDNQPNGVVYAGPYVYQYKGNSESNDTCIVLKEGTLGIAAGAIGSYQKGIKASVEMKNENKDIKEILYDLKKIVIPNTVTFIGNVSFQCCDLTNIEIPNSVKTIGKYAFAWNNPKKVSIGKSVTSIGDGAFYFFESSVSDIICYAPLPPACENYTFDGSYKATLHVPASSLAAYFTAPYWCNFESIVGDAVEPTGITISNDRIESNLGEQFNLTATVSPANASTKEVAWYSTDTNVAKVEDGTVTAVGYGECDILACCFGMRVICHVSVTQRISLDQQEAMVLPNHILTLTPSASPVLPELTVTSSDPMVAAARVMNGKVQVVGVTEGIVTITVGSKDGMAVPATCLVTVYTVMGDVNMDGFVNITDVTRLINYLLSGDGEYFKTGNADLNNDGQINISDVTQLINKLLTGS